MKSKTQYAIESGFKFQIGFFDINGNYTRMGFLKTGRKSQIQTYATKNNLPINRVQIQVLQYA